jgi:hypothetical protein
MLLRHATPARNLHAILRSGPLTGKSRGKLPPPSGCAAPPRRRGPSCTSSGATGARSKRPLSSKSMCPGAGCGAPGRGFATSCGTCPPAASAACSASPSWRAPARKPAEPSTGGAGACRSALSPKEPPMLTTLAVLAALAQIESAPLPPLLQCVLLAFIASAGLARLTSRQGRSVGDAVFKVRAPAAIPSKSARRCVGRMALA